MCSCQVVDECLNKCFADTDNPLSLTGVRKVLFGQFYFEKIKKIRQQCNNSYFREVEISSKSVHCTILYGTSNVSQGFNNKTRVFLSDHLIYFSLLVPTKALKKDVNLCLCSAIPR